MESLLARGADGDLQEAQAAIDRLDEVPVEAGFALTKSLCCGYARWWLEQGDEAGRHKLMERCRAKAASAGFEPLVAVNAR